MFVAGRKTFAVIIPDIEVIEWWSCWWLVVKLSMEKPMVRWLMDVEVEVMAAEEDKDDNGKKTRGESLFFSKFGL
jgi:hypothetical protein